ncbi:transcriptional regulator PtsJ [Vibrio sp. 10N.261.55.A7]|uniref:MocR-like B6 salvage transcription factor PtsJ n=1 Tax=Vibrio sp. 10N.261.55.A7 TaxID=1880851 RepID=UPI000C85B490|nr:transcriptional regulator PtsJ [Vibrio sp. 10N.261.55.A7]PMK02274.1 transcriptional regulator PtsJ [Vibrio sp. 10N.261.55.A7]
MKIDGKTALEVSDSIRKLVQEGDIRAGDTLPPVRELAEKLGINRNTVALAYQRLVKSGTAITQGRLGTRICAPPEAGEQEGLSTSTTLTDLADGNPNPAWLPNPQDLLAECLPSPHLYGDETVLPKLRQFAEETIYPDCPNHADIELTNGAIDALERLIAAHLVSGDKVAVEDPCFLGTTNVLRLANIQAIGVDVDKSGMCPEKLEHAIKQGARAVIITPRAHNPTGCSLTLSRAEAIKKVLRKHPNVLVIVDDHFSLLSDTSYYSIIPDATTHWALIRSVSKFLGPDLRFAFLACDRATASRLRARLAPGMTWVSRIIQSIVHVNLASNDTLALIQQAREDYILRRSTLCSELDKKRIKYISGGLNVWIQLPKNARDVTHELAQRGWLVRQGSAFLLQSKVEAIRVTTSKLEQTQATTFVSDLDACLKRR